jgi:N utilization substance protein B
MSARSKARKRALDILFESELQGRELGASLDDRTAAPGAAVPAYAVTLVKGVVAHSTEIDATISRYSQGWTIERMPAVDRNILRLAIFELQHEPDVPAAVVLSEAVELARDLSTDESPSFVNGLLATVASECAVERDSGSEPGSDPGSEPEPAADRRAE